MIDKNAVANLLESIASKMEFIKENRYKISAYRNGADAIRRSKKDIEHLVKEKKLGEIEGIGKGLESVIYEYYAEGYSTLYNELLVEVPAEIETMLKLKGLTPAKIKLLHTQLGITNIESLEDAIHNNRLPGVKGFNSELQEKLLEQIESLKVSSKYVLLGTAYRYRAMVRRELEKLTSIVKFESTGEMRRGAEVVSSIEFMVLVKNEDEFFTQLSDVYELSRNSDMYTVSDYFLIPLLFYTALDEKEYCAKLFITTGSKGFLRKVVKDPLKISGDTEEDIFIKQSAPYVIPEMREEETLQAAPVLRTNSDLVYENYKGLLHFHSTYSDGKETLKNMIGEAERRGFKYAVICDHSKYAYYANGLTEERVKQQTKELKALSSSFKLQLFQGIECDILKDGSLDFDDSFLTSFDFVVASIHKRFTLSEKEMTARIIRAVENPHTDLLAHPSGRFLLERAPYEFNVKKVIEACSANEVAIEINANPKRLDLDWRWIYFAREKGCLFSINSDAHSIPEIIYINYGIKLARKGGLQSGEVINYFNLSQFKKFLKRKINRKFKIPGNK